MQLKEITYDGQPPIDSYGPGFFRVEDKIHDGNLLMLPSGVFSWGGFDDLDQIIAATETLDVIFIGTGDAITQIPVATREIFEKNAVPFEIMASPSASRTYNILLSEGRRVGAALIAV
ncbi:membrane protein [Amylibacter ulvae]|uniref:Membrane protein n=1 Tax=Paramylibacter ulvae TaxID=1651968 RepID=A0ABQ3D217_9RHOB|nr:Mth938-like domain-containing protein [Amylibacter ulvae]GHA53716.1 membrane protein [Amylibacter ulvae]